MERELPETMLLAEAFWLLEGYFVRGLGMHRVYNSAFMTMLRDGDGLSYEEIAAELGIGLSAVKMRIKRGREEFRRRFGSEA